MKKIISLIIAAAMLTAPISVFAENDESFDTAMQDVEQAAEEQIAEDALKEALTVETPEETADAGVTENLVPEHTGSYKQGDVYSTVSAYETATADEIAAASAADMPEYVPDDELLLSTMSLTSDISGWEVCSSMSEAKSYMSSVAVEDKIYTFGGTKSGSVINTAEVFDTVNNLWTYLTDMPVGCYKHNALYVSGNIYICGGYNEDGEAVSGISVYNIANDAWADNNIATPNNNTKYASGIYDGELYIFGGEENGTATKNSYKYNFTTNKWTQVMSMPISSTDAKALPTSFGFYVLYGTKVAKYDISKQDFEWVDNLPYTVEDYACITRDYTSTSSATPSQTNGLMVSGGRENASSASLATVKARVNTDYTFIAPWSPEWYNDLRLGRGLAAHNMVVADGFIYVFGGQTSPGTDQRIMYKRSLSEWHDDYPDNNIYDLSDGSVYGSINDKNDVDNFRFTPSESGKYEITVFDAIQTANGGYKYNIKVVEETTGTEITDSDLPIYLGGIPMEAEKSYIIKVTDTAATWTGNYFFKVNKVEDDAPDVIDEAIELPLETTISKTFLGKLDVDCMYFDIPVTGMYDIEVIANGNTVATIKINDNDDNNTLLYNYKSNDYTVKNVRLNAGKYYISLSASGTDYDYENPEYAVRISNTELYKQMNAARYRHGLAAVNGKLYAIGGLNSEYETETMTEEYNPSTGMWKKTAESDNTIRQGTTAIAVESKIYLVGGIDDYSRGAMKYYPLDDSIMIYDTAANTWTGTGDLGIDRERVGLAVKDGDIYIAGGRMYDETEYSNAIQVYNISTGMLTDYPVSLPNGIVDPQIFFSDDTMYVVGGVDSDGYSDKVYALEDSAWVQKASMPYASRYMRGKGFNDNFYCATVNNSGDVDVLKYDSIDDEWTYIYGNYPNVNGFIENLSYYAVDILNGMMYISGGYSSVDDEIKNDIHCIDVVTDISAMDIAIHVRTIGFEYEQTVNDDTIGAPKILGVNAKVLDSSNGIYELYLTEDDYSCDTRNAPFFFWSAREGMFTALEDNYTRVMFYADKGTGNRQVKVVVGIGDGRGYVDKKAFLLDGNNETE